MTEQNIKGHSSRFKQEIESFFMSSAFRILYETILQDSLPDQLYITSVNEEGCDPLPQERLILFKDGNTILVDIFQAINSIKTKDSNEKVQINRLLPVVKKELERIKEVKNKFKELDLEHELQTIEDISKSDAEKNKEDVQQLIKHYLIDDQCKNALLYFLDKSEKNKIQFMTIIFRFGITVEYDKYLPLLSRWLRQKVKEFRQKIEFEVNVCSDENSLSATLDSIRQGLKDGNYLGDYKFLRRRELLGFLDIIEPREREKITKIKIFNEQNQKIQNLIKMSAEGRDARNSQLLEFIRRERDLINLVPHLNDKAIITFIENICKIVDKIMGWKPDTFNIMQDNLKFAGYLNEIKHFLIDAEKLLSERESSEDNPEQHLQNKWSAAKKKLRDTKRSFHKLVMFDLQPAFEKLIENEIIMVPFEHITDVQLAFDELIALTQSIENKRSLFSEQFYSDNLMKLDKAVEKLKKNIVGFTSQQIGKLNSYDNFSLEKQNHTKLSEVPQNIVIAKEIVAQLKRKNITPKLFHTLFGTYLPEDILSMKQKMSRIEEDISWLTSTLKAKDDLIREVAKKMNTMIDPSRSRYDIKTSKTENGLKIKLVSSSDNKKSFNYSIDWLHFQKDKTALFTVKLDFFRNIHWIIKLVFPQTSLFGQTKKQPAGETILHDIPAIFERNMRKYKFVEIRERLESISPDNKGVVNHYLTTIKWLETVQKESELAKTETFLTEIIRLVDPLFFLEEFKTLGIPFYQADIDVLKAFLNKSDKIHVPTLEKCLENNFKIDECLFLPIRCREDCVSLQTMIDDWLKKAGRFALNDIYSSFFSMVDKLRVSLDETSKEINVSAFSDSEQQIFELLKPLISHQGGKEVFNKILGLISENQQALNLNFLLDTVIKENLSKMNEQMTEQLIKIIHSQYEKLKQRVYEGNAILQMEISEAILETITTLHNNRVIHWSLKPSNILVTKKGKNPVKIALLDFEKSIFIRKSLLQKDIIDETFFLPANHDSEYSLHPFWFFAERAVFHRIPLLRVGDLQILSATIVELLLGYSALSEDYTNYIKQIDEYGSQIYEALHKKYHHLMTKSFHEITNHIGEFSWFQQLELFISQANEIVKKNGIHTLLEHDPSLPYFIKPGERTKKIIHFFRKSDEALLELTSKQVERITGEWLQSLIKKLNQHFTLVSIVKNRLRWQLNERSLEIIYSVIHYNPGKSIIIGLRFHWHERKKSFLSNRDELIISIPLDVYRTISYSVITRGLVDTKLRDQFISFIQTESVFRQRIPELKDIVVFSCPDKFIDILGQALELSVDQEKDLIRQLLLNRRGGIGLSRVLQKYFSISIDGRDYMIKPYKFMEGQTLEAWMRKDEHIALERDILKDVLEVFIERTVPWCELTSPHDWAHPLKIFRTNDWKIIRAFFEKYNFQKGAALLKEEKFDQEKLLDQILDFFWDIPNENANINMDGLNLTSEKQRQLIKYFLERKEEKKKSEEDLLENQRNFINKIAVIKLAMFYHICHKNSVIHRDLKPANIMLKQPDNPAKPFVDVKIIDTEGTLWKEGNIIKGFFPEALISITPDYSSPYILQWLLEQSSKGDRYFELLQEYDAFSLFIIFFELLQSRKELKNLMNGVYDEYCLKISGLIRNPLFMGYIYAKNESDISYDFSKEEFIDSFHFDELVTVLQNDFGITCSRTLEALNACLKSKGLYQKLRNNVNSDLLKEVDSYLEKTELSGEYRQKKHNRYLLSRLYQQVCPKPQETKQSLFSKYKEHILQVTLSLVEVQELFEDLLLTMYNNLSDDIIKYTLFHWFLIPTGIAFKLDLKKPPTGNYGDLQYRLPQTDNTTTFVERTPKIVDLLNKMKHDKDFRVLNDKDRIVKSLKPLTPLEAFLRLGKQLTSSFKS